MGRAGGLLLLDIGLRKKLKKQSDTSTSLIWIHRELFVRFVIRLSTFGLSSKTLNRLENQGKWKETLTLSICCTHDGLKWHLSHEDVASICLSEIVVDKFKCFSSHLEVMSLLKIGNEATSYLGWIGDCFGGSEND